MPTKIERDPNDPLLRPDYIRFSWRKSKPPEDEITRKQENDEDQLSQYLLDVEESLEDK